MAIREPRVMLVVPSPTLLPRRSDLARRTRDLLWCALRDHGLQLSPSLLEDQLRSQLGVSRNAVREALDYLRQDGRVGRVPGLGTFPIGDGLLHRCDRLHGFEDSLAHGASRVSYQVLWAEQIDAPPLLRNALELDGDEQAVLLERLTLLDGRPATLRSHWLPARYARILSFDLRQDFYAIVERDLGLVVGEGFMVIDAVRADLSSAPLLDVKPGAPLLLLENTTRLRDGALLQVSFARTRSDRAALTSRSTREIH